MGGILNLVLWAVVLFAVLGGGLTTNLTDLLGSLGL